MSNGEGTFDFYLPGHSEAASLRPVQDEFYKKNSDDLGRYTGNTEMKKVECKVTTLDTFFKEQHIKRVDFIKIDVEGNEKFVLEGQIVRKPSRITW